MPRRRRVSYLRGARRVDGAPAPLGPLAVPARSTRCRGGSGWTWCVEIQRLLTMGARGPLRMSSGDRDAAAEWVTGVAVLAFDGVVLRFGSHAAPTTSLASRPVVAPRTRGQILVTGGAGFVGRALLRELHARGAESVVAPTSYKFDLTRPEDVEAAFDEVRPDLVIHLAARVGGIGANQARPATLYLANLLMGTYVIEEARRRGTPKTVVAGTICSYPKFTPVPFREESLWDGFPEETNAPYGIAKKALLVHAQANRTEFDQNIVYVMPTNLYGPGDKFNPAVSHVIPALIKKCVEAQERGDDAVEVWGTGLASREFLYVDDAARGIADAAERYDGPEPVNLGSGEEILVKRLAELIAEAVGFTGKLHWDPTKPDGQPRRQLDTSRAAELFGFRATTPFADGLRRTVEWYRTHRDEAEARTA
jgi:GDP-L-fucose synthase